MAAKLAFLDRILANYGSESHEARDALHRSIASVTEYMWPPQGSKPAELDPSATGGEALYQVLQQLSPKTDQQTALKTHALALASDIGQTRWLLLEQKYSSISTPMLVIVVFWLTTVFVSFGLFAPSNSTVIITIFLCALSVAGSIFLMLELDQPFGGMVQISDASMRNTLGHIGK
jgi:hypothetical protein